jgi:Family of unknown function (DUF6278)
VASDPTKGTDDVSGAAVPVPADDDGASATSEVGLEEQEPGPDSGETATDPPSTISDLASACVRFVASRYKVTLDYKPDTISFVDQWLRDARGDVQVRPEVADVVQSAAGAYLGEVIRRQFGGSWWAEGEPSGWRLYLSRVYCAFNPIGMAREALLLEPAEGWHAHFELDPGEKEGVEARLEALPAASDEEYYAPSTRFDVLWIVVDALRASLRSRGLDDVRFSPDDYR